MFDPYRPYAPRRGQCSNSLHPARNGLRTAFFAAAVTVSVLLPIVWVLDAIGALK